jgi:hypothetical protein
MLAVVALLVVYLAWPYWSSWRLYEAVHARDATALAGKVDWASFRANLKTSLLDRLQRSGNRVVIGVSGAEHSGRLSFTLTPESVDALVSRYATPEGLADLLVLEGLLKGPKPPNWIPLPKTPDTSPVATDSGGPRRRLVWAFFSSPTSFEIEVQLPTESREIVVPVLELGRWGWLLTDLRFRSASAIKAAAY